MSNSSLAPDLKTALEGAIHPVRREDEIVMDIPVTGTIMTLGRNHRQFPSARRETAEMLWWVDVQINGGPRVYFGCHQENLQKLAGNEEIGTLAGGVFVATVTCGEVPPDNLMLREPQSVFFLKDLRKIAPYGPLPNLGL